MTVRINWNLKRITFRRFMGMCLKVMKKKTLTILNEVIDFSISTFMEVAGFTETSVPEDQYARRLSPKDYMC